MMTPARQESTALMPSLLLRILDGQMAASLTAFYRLSPDQRNLTLDGYVSASPVLARGLARAAVFPSGPAGGLIGLTAERRTSLYLSNTIADGRWTAFGPATHSAFFVPMLCRDQTLGVFAFFTEGVDAFDDGFRWGLEIIVALVGEAQSVEDGWQERSKGIEASLARFYAEMARFGYGRSGPIPSAGEVELDLSSMTPREQEILRVFMVHGEISAIASKLEISPHTVRNHLKAIYRKLGVHSQAELLRKLQFPNP